MLHALRATLLPDRVSLLHVWGVNERRTIYIARHQVLHGALLFDGHHGTTGQGGAGRRLTQPFKCAGIGQGQGRLFVAAATTSTAVIRVSIP